MFKLAVLIALGLSMVGGVAHAERGNFRVSVGAERSTEKLDVDGALLGSLAPRTDFHSVSEDDRYTPYFGVDYEQPLGTSLFVGAEVHLTVGSSQQTLSADASTTVVYRAQICYPRFGHPVAPCEWGVPDFMTATYTEQQKLDLSVKSGPAVSSIFKAGFVAGPLRAWIGGGPAVQWLRMSYSLPELYTVKGPLKPVHLFTDPSPLFPPSMILSAESRKDTVTRLGGTLAAGLADQLTKRLSVSARYAFADYGTVTLNPTARLGATTIKSKTKSVAVALDYAF
uniref:hypothetical protein n=1 Tax=Altererythrobacter segetis TaxID=1104773 RepID=UPI00140DA757|nr:hypothetical protein [Altererythrobacter segetis]